MKTVSPSLARTTGLIVIGLICATALGACGRRGPLEPPPGAPDARRATADSPFSRSPARAAQAEAAPEQAAPAASTFAGSPTFRPVRETETSGPERNAPDGAPPVPMDPVQALTTPGANLPGASTVTSAQSGLSARPQQRGQRYSPPPDRPFILDPLL